MKHRFSRALALLAVCAAVMPIGYGDAQRGWRLHRQTESLPASAEALSLQYGGGSGTVTGSGERFSSLTILAGLAHQGVTIASGGSTMPRCDRQEYVAGLQRDGVVRWGDIGPSHEETLRAVADRVECTNEPSFTLPVSGAAFCTSVISEGTSTVEERIRLFRNSSDVRGLDSQSASAATNAYALVFPHPIFQEGKLGECMNADDDGTPSWGVCR